MAELHRRDVAQFGSAPALGAGCRRVESCRPDQLFDIDADRNPLAFAVISSTCQVFLTRQQFPVRVWFNGRTAAFQAANAGSIPVTRSIKDKEGPAVCRPFQLISCCISVYIKEGLFFKPLLTLCLSETLNQRALLRFIKETPFIRGGPPDDFLDTSGCHPKNSRYPFIRYAPTTSRFRNSMMSFDSYSALPSMTRQGDCPLPPMALSSSAFSGSRTLRCSILMPWSSRKRSTRAQKGQPGSTYSSKESEETMIILSIVSSKG